MSLRCAACVNSGTDTTPQPAVALLIHKFDDDVQMVFESCMKHNLFLHTPRMGSVPDGFVRKC